MFTYNRENCEEEFMFGYNEMLKRIKPTAIICYDEPFKSMTGILKNLHQQHMNGQKI